jgi:hypothetical protein
MDTAPTISSSTLGAAPRSRSALQVAAIGALAATVVNVALWAGGRASDVGVGSDASPAWRRSVPTACRTSPQWASPAPGCHRGGWATRHIVLKIAGCGCSTGKGLTWR